MSDTENIVVISTSIFVLISFTVWLCYLSIRVIPGTVRSTAFRISIYSLFFIAWSLFSFGAIAYGARHTRVEAWLWSAFSILLQCDAVCLILCCGALVVGLVATFTKAHHDPKTHDVTN